MIRKVLVFLFVLAASIGTTVNFWRPSAVWDRYRRGYAEFERRLRVRRMKATARKKIANIVAVDEASKIPDSVLRVVGRKLVRQKVGREFLERMERASEEEREA